MASLTHDFLKYLGGGIVYRCHGVVSAEPLTASHQILDNREQVIEIAKTGEYITSSELASTPSFRSLLQDPSFKKQLALVIDEAHLIVHWGKKLRTLYLPIAVTHLLPQLY